MTDERGRGGRTFTHTELDEHVASFFGVGGLYELVAYYVEQGERPRCTGATTDVRPPWYRA
ncbi:hypothetical protein SEA_FUZZBUSTER_64 [Microbacterium phage FuzzBuster]|uniref:Uncharacterized protein n=1 Tax=Microbacterium phage FuzzBuster TaxID=2590935 RepID=A0A516KV38_9CAUD|nr:hypothetical protein SEA_FUZZBUSTER_64 [Microbacterium phage FuzzBuster]